MVLRVPGVYDATQVSRESRPRTTGQSLTKQSFKDAADINGIVRRFGLTGQLPIGNSRVPMTGDFADAPDFQTSMNLVIAARKSFEALPAKWRERFGHDPANFLAFVEDPRNADEAVRLGLLERPPERTRDVVQAVDELAAQLRPKDGVPKG